MRGDCNVRGAVIAPKKVQAVETFHKDAVFATCNCGHAELIAWRGL